MNKMIHELINEDISSKKECNLCNEINLSIGQKTNYGAFIVYKIGISNKEAWFATLSPKTGGNPEKDFTIQLMPIAHLTHFSQINSYPELAKNYGIAFSKINAAMTEVMAKEQEFKATADIKESAVSIVIYGKCTNWKDKKEHLHIKVSPFRGNIGQPFTVDSSFGRKEIYKDNETGEDFVKMKPVRKKMINEERLEYLSNQLIQLLND